jgi:hypothetical protein
MEEAEVGCLRSQPADDDKAEQAEEHVKCKIPGKRDKINLADEINSPEWRAYGLQVRVRGPTTGRNKIPPG